ncbi:hypothetical protein [Dyella sp. Tek66A03]|uniref:hypothetical protein n=1 Tax=Dyella sp. Tek66A03 TaxID=3458298 RepID=UPI00403EF30D
MHISSINSRLTRSSLAAVELVRKTGSDGDFKFAENLLTKKIKNANLEQSQLMGKGSVKKYLEYRGKMTLAVALKSRGNDGDKAEAKKLFREANRGALESGNLGGNGYRKSASVEKYEGLTKSLSKYKNLSDELFKIRNEQVEKSMPPRSGNGSALIGVTSSRNFVVIQK